METFTELRDFVASSDFLEQRQKLQRTLEINTIDVPISDIISGFMQLPYCFTIQSCYGHFLHNDQQNPYCTEPLPISDSIAKVEYRIAYVALCIQDCAFGRTLFQNLKQISEIEPEYIQFGCADWFWKRRVNSYALQVEPKRYMCKDSIVVGYQEALHIEETRNRFFDQLRKLLPIHLERADFT